MKRSYIYIILIVLGSTIFTTLIIQIPNPFFNDIGSKDAWITFFGAITGGLLTLCGVWWTIKEQESNRKKDLAVQYMPLITCDEYKVETNNIESNILDAISSSVFATFKGEILRCNLKEVKIILKFTNHGRGEAIVTKLNSALTIYPAEDDNFIDECHDNPLNDHEIILPFGLHLSA